MSGIKETSELIPPHLVAAVGLAWISVSTGFPHSITNSTDTISISGGPWVASCGRFLEDVRVTSFGVFLEDVRVASFGAGSNRQNYLCFCVLIFLCLWWRLFVKFPIVTV